MSLGEGGGLLVNWLNVVSHHCFSISSSVADYSFVRIKIASLLLIEYRTWIVSLKLNEKFPSEWTG